MKSVSHQIFVVFLFMVGGFALLAPAVKGWDYYLTPAESRPFRNDYRIMKPSGVYSHGLGILGSLMIFIGVSTYSTRKRVKALRDIGKLSYWLEFHIFLCLVGPLLIIYHTTFKAGGIAAVSLWTMLSVVASGVIGKYLYAQIPRKMNGSELTLEEIQSEVKSIEMKLQNKAVGTTIIKLIDNAFTGIPAPKTMSESITTIIRLERIRSQVKRAIRLFLSQSNISKDVMHDLTSAASLRTSLIQKSIALGQVERFFFYWHAIHLPFAIIMFLTLAAHVIVTVVLGYRWIF